MPEAEQEPSETKYKDIVDESAFSIKSSKNCSAGMLIVTLETKERRDGSRLAIRAERPVARGDGSTEETIEVAGDNSFRVSESSMSKEAGIEEEGTEGEKCEEQEKV